MTKQVIRIWVGNELVNEFNGDRIQFNNMYQNVCNDKSRKIRTRTTSSYSYIDEKGLVNFVRLIAKLRHTANNNREGQPCHQRTIITTI